MNATPHPPDTMCAAFQRTVARQPAAPALRVAGSSSVITWAEYAERVSGIAAGLAAIGVGRGDPVALMLTNRPEFHLVDTAAQHLGAVPFSCYNSSSSAQIGAILTASGTCLAVTEKQFVPALAPHLAAPANPLRRLVVVDADGDSRLSLTDLVAAGAPGFDLAAAASAITPADLLTLVYTSGTTGSPKGVEITHANMVAMAAATARLIDVRPGDRMISFLPTAHIADRWASHYLHLWCGTDLTCLPDPRAILDTLRQVRPTHFGGVPQIWQRLAGGVTAAVGAQPEPQRTAIGRAVETGLRYQRARATGDVPAALAEAYAAADAQALAPLRARLGLDQTRVAVTSATPTPPEVVDFFTAIGIPLVEAWGMSEVGGMGTMVPPGTVRPGSIGLPIPGLEARLAADGELLVRGPAVMRGYHNQPDETAAVLDPDGWLHSGDIATRDRDGFFRIIGRKKELLITTGGNNIAPMGVEVALRAHGPLLAQAVVVGDARPHLVALLVLDPEAAGRFAAAPQLTTDPAALAAHPTVLDAVAAGVAKANATLSRAEQIRSFVLLPEVWLPGSEALTPTHKVRREAILQTYADRIDALYASHRAAGATPGSAP